MHNPNFTNMNQRVYPHFHAAGLDPKRERKIMARALFEKKGIKNQDVLQALATVPRHLFVQAPLQPHAYQDTPLPIGYGQTISQPFTVAKMTELLEVGMHTRVLEIGTGSGYQAAILATLGCNVISLERIPELCRKTAQLLKKLGYLNIHVRRGDGTLGFPQAAPYDRIIVTAGAPKIPAPLVQQLGDGGIMLIPVGIPPREQKLVRIKKINGNIATEILDPVTFVDLVEGEGLR